MMDGCVRRVMKGDDAQAVVGNKEQKWRKQIPHQTSFKGLISKYLAFHSS